MLTNCFTKGYAQVNVWHDRQVINHFNKLLRRLTLQCGFNACLLYRDCVTIKTEIIDHAISFGIYDL